MTNKAVRYGIVGVAVVLLVVTAFAGVVSAEDKHIYTVQQWCDNVTSGFSEMRSSETIFLENDLNFSDCSSDIRISSLAAKIDGKNHTISNFSISLSDSNYAGLIGTYTGNSISNLIISNFSVSGSGYVGVLVGYANTAITFENVIVMNGEATSSSSNSGGLVGYAFSKTKNIVNCTVKNCRLSGREGVGGLFGSAGYTSVSVNMSRVNGCDISVSNMGVGGLIGYVVSACGKIDLKNSEVANCVVKSGTGYSGGCLGYNGYQGSNNRTIDNCTVKNCAIYVRSSSGSDPCGGIIGGCVQGEISSKYPKVSNCRVEFCTIAGKGTNSVGGIAGTFPTAGILDRNNVISSCIVSVSGKAAGICPSAS